MFSRSTYLTASAGTVAGIAITVGAFSLWGNTHLSSPQTPVADQDTWHVVSTTSDPYFAHPEPYLKALILQRHKEHQNNVFCIVMYQNRIDPQSLSAWVYWPQDNAIILWEPAWTPDTKDANLYESRRYLHLGADVTATDTKWSTFMETLGWVGDVIHDCTTMGRLYQFGD